MNRTGGHNVFVGLRKAEVVFCDDISARCFKNLRPPYMWGLYCRMVEGKAFNFDRGHEATSIGLGQPFLEYTWLERGEKNVQLDRISDTQAFTRVCFFVL